MRVIAILRQHASRRSDTGFSLIELVVAITIFGIVMLGLALTIGSGLALTRTNRHRTVAANLAAQEMDTIRSAEFTSIEPATSTFTVEGITYTVDRETTWVAKSATSGPCDGNGGSPQVLRVRVSVTWPNMRGVRPVVSDTTLRPPVGAYDPNTGHVGVKVLDRDASPVFNVPVALNGPASDTLTTNSEGCAFFAFLPEGTYTAALGSAGWVDRQSNATPQQTVGVTIGNIASVQFDYDRAATLDVSFQTDLAYPIPDDLSVTVANPQLVPNGLKSYVGTGVTPSIPDLYPFLDGYHAWAGSCADADPEGAIVGDDGSGNPVSLGSYWPGATRDDTIAVTGGGTSAATLHLHDVDIQVVDALSFPVVGAEVVVEHAPDNVCGDGETHVVGTTDAAGHVAGALPYGTWSVRVTGQTPVGAWPDAVMDPTNHSPVVVQAVVS